MALRVFPHCYSARAMRIPCPIPAMEMPDTVSKLKREDLVNAVQHLGAAE